MTNDRISLAPMYNDMIINKRGVLCLAHVNEGGIQSVMPIGIRAARSGIRQIEASPRELAASTKARLAVLKAGVALWEARAR